MLLLQKVVAAIDMVQVAASSSVTKLTTTNYIGIADAAYSNGATNNPNCRIN